MTMQLRNLLRTHPIKFAVFVGTEFCSILSAMLLFWCCYWYPDARYIRDNYNYVQQRFAEVGYPMADIQSWDPLALNLYRLHYYVEDYTLGYLQIAASVEPESVNLADLRSNPYDTISRLVLDGYAEDVQDVYTDIAYCAAACQEDFSPTKEYISLWLKQREPYRLKALKACQSQAYVFLLLFGSTIFFASFLLIWVFKFFN